MQFEEILFRARRVCRFVVRESLVAFQPSFLVSSNFFPNAPFFRWIFHFFCLSLVPHTNGSISTISIPSEAVHPKKKTKIS